MTSYTVRIPPDLQAFIRNLHPEMRRKIRAALDAIQSDPFLGKPLKGLLQGLYSYRASRYRIIYEVKTKILWIEVIDIDHRKIIYNKTASSLKK